MSQTLPGLVTGCFTLDSHLELQARSDQKRSEVPEDEYLELVCNSLWCGCRGGMTVTDTA